MRAQFPNRSNQMPRYSKRYVDGRDQFPSTLRTHRISGCALDSALRCREAASVFIQIAALAIPYIAPLRLAEQAGVASGERFTP
jgi:hypothetical protein